MTRERNHISDSITDHVAGLRRYARSLARNPVDADDLVQECLTRALARLTMWQEVRDLRAYLFTILHHIHADSLARRRAEGNVVPIEDALRTYACKPAQMGRIEVNELMRAVSGLTEEQRNVVLLAGVAGLKYEEIARVLDIPVGTVMSRLNRAREALRRTMNGEERARGRRVVDG